MNESISTRILLLIFVGIMGCSLHKDASLEKVAIDYEKAWYFYDWGKMSKLLHPESLTQFKEITLFLNAKLDSINAKSENKDKVDSLIDYIRNPEVQKLPPEMFFSNVMNVALPTEAINSVVHSPMPTIDCLGHVSEGRDSAHVVMRVYITKEGTAMNSVILLSLKRFESEWRVLLSDELANRMKLSLRLHH